MTKTIRVSVELIYFFPVTLMELYSKFKSDPNEPFLIQLLEMTQCRFLYSKTSWKEAHRTAILNRTASITSPLSSSNNRMDDLCSVWKTRLLKCIFDNKVQVFFLRGRHCVIELVEVAEHRKGGDVEVEVVHHLGFPPPDSGAAILARRWLGSSFEERLKLHEGKLLLGNRVCHSTINVPDVKLTRDCWGRPWLRFLDVLSYITFTTYFSSCIIADQKQNSYVFTVISLNSPKGRMKKEWWGGNLAKHVVKWRWSFISSNLILRK